MAISARPCSPPSPGGGRTTSCSSTPATRRTPWPGTRSTARMPCSDRWWPRGSSRPSRDRPNSDTGGEFHLPPSHGVMRRSGTDGEVPDHRTGLPLDPRPMSLRPQPARSIPDETQRVAQAAFPKGTLCLRIAEELGPLDRDDQFATLFSTRGQPADSPARLAMVSVLQYVEGLSDRQAADAVRGRIDWKYALGLELTDPGFDHTVLSEFRCRLVQGQAEQQLLDTLLERCRELELIRERGRQRTDSTHVLAAVRVLNRLERVGETLRAALNDLAVMAPDWLQGLAPAEWYSRYGRRVENYHLPKTDAAREELARVVAADGERLLAAIDAATDQPVLAQLPAVVTLRRVWAEQYTGEPGQLRWREVKDMPSPAGLISSPYDTDARYSTKRDVEWVGYKAHLTETCDEDRPHLIVNVETTPATTPDDNMIKEVHESEKGRDLLPGEHLVDKGYTDSM